MAKVDPETNSVYAANFDNTIVWPVAPFGLGDHTACPLLVSGSVEHPVPPAVGMAIYQLVSEASQAVPADSPLTVDLGGGRTDPALVTISGSSTPRTDSSRQAGD